MKSDPAAMELNSSDFKDLGNAAKKLANHAITLGGLGFGTAFLKWLAFVAAVFLLTLDRTNRKTNMLIPYIFFILPNFWFNLFRGEFGKWIAIIAVVPCLFSRERFRGWLELPVALIIVIVVAPSLFAETIRGNWMGVVICLVIGSYLLQEHIRASDGFTKPYGISNTIGIILLLLCGFYN